MVTIVVVAAITGGITSMLWRMGEGLAFMWWVKKQAPERRIRDLRFMDMGDVDISESVVTFPRRPRRRA